ncbi:MAG: DEAD/DEAH box helicase [Planctomycetota bacterium]
MPHAAFHLAVERWFRSKFARPTPVQLKAWEAIASGRHTLVAAPTGSGKTLAAFLALARSADSRRARAHAARRDARAVRLAAEGAEQRHPQEPHRAAARDRTGAGRARAARGEDTRRGALGRHAERRASAMMKRPPHLLVTTPESLYLMLTAERGRRLLKTVTAVIVDEIHAVIESRRGRTSHCRSSGCSTSPWAACSGSASATQRPVEEVARFLLGAGESDCEIIDEGHRRDLDLAIELPGTPLEAVMTGEAWEEVYGRLVELIGTHRTTLIFANTRRLAERLSRQLSDRLGERAVTAHHGSLAKERRLDAETRLKSGSLRALVATASLELGIDIGHVDLVCQIGSPRRIATLLQRVGRSGHTVSGTPKGRIFPLTRDELVECAALVHEVRRGELDRICVPQNALDVLAQQIVAEVACEEWHEDALYDLVRRAHPYRQLARSDFEQVVSMLASGFTTQRGRRGALIMHDALGKQLRARRQSRLLAITSGGAIPENADYRVVLEPTETLVGTINEDFAIESMAGDIFQLGNASWRILKVEPGRVRVADAKGEPPTIPFWLGEAPSRSAELSAAVATLHAEIESRVAAGAAPWLAAAYGLAPAASEQIAQYLGESKRILGALPTHEQVVLERFFDDAGGMQLVVHALFGSRINRALGLALRKCFCRRFNFELQAAATENAIVLSLGPQHSFPLDDVQQYLTPRGLKDVLVQAVLAAPMFMTRWRWNATRSLAIPRNRAGSKVPAPLQRMMSDDLLAAAFPDAAACAENLTGPIEIPDHPLVRQTITDCLEEAMDVDGARGVLERLARGELEFVTRDTAEPSPLAHEILNAKPYAFLDDAPLEERRTQAVVQRRALERSSLADLSALDAAAIARVKAEAWPQVETADELHEALVTTGFLTAGEGRAAGWQSGFDELVAAGRARLLRGDLWVALERMPEMTSALDQHALEAAREVLRSRLEALGPITAAALNAPLGLPAELVEGGLHALESQGIILRGVFTPGGSELEWCERRLLARIHRHTLNRLRAEIEPVSAADFMRFLFEWQNLAGEHRRAGPGGVAQVLEQLDGYEVPACAWELDVLPARVADYDPLWLDGLCLAGQAGWGRLSSRRAAGSGARPLRSTPITLFAREHLPAWIDRGPEDASDRASSPARQVLAVLERHGASFFGELQSATRLLGTQVENALGELVALGRVTCDSFGGLRAVDPERAQAGNGAPTPGRGGAV